MMEKVLLIVPPVTLALDRPNFNLNFPMGLGYLAAVLEQAGYDVVALDAVGEALHQETPLAHRTDRVRVGMTADQITSFIRDCRPDAVGITSMFTKQFGNTIFVADLVKSVDPDLPVIVGGAHATADPSGVIENPSIDFVVTGEGEETMLRVLEVLEGRGSLDALEGVVFRGADGNTVTRPGTTVPDVNRLPFPAWHLFPMEKYFASGERHGLTNGASGMRSASILTSRGCPYSCNFCSVYQQFGKKLRRRNNESVIEEIDRLVETYQINDLFLVDDQFIGKKRETVEVLDSIISRNYGITMDAPNGLSPWLLDETIISKMKQVGFWRLNLAVESGNKTILRDMINKPVNLDQLPDIVRLARQYHLGVSAFLVVGNVSETEIETFDQIQDSFDLMRRLGIRNLSVSYLSPHIGSEVYDVLMRRGFIDAHYFDNDYDRPGFSTPLWTRRELERFVEAQKVLNAIEGKPLFWPIKVLAQDWNGILLQERRGLIVWMAAVYRRMKAARRSRPRPRASHETTVPTPPSLTAPPAPRYRAPTHTLSR